METTTNANPERVEVQIDLGFLFATLHASFVGNDAFGAHVTLDGTVIANGNLRHADERHDAIDRVRMFRAECLHQIRMAHAEIGAEFGKAEEDLARRQIIAAVPMTPAMIAVYGTDGV